MSKMGAATGPASAVYSEYRAFYGIPESKYLDRGETREHQLLFSSEGVDTGLASPEDSGSVVYNGDAVVFGLLLGE